MGKTKVQFLSDQALQQNAVAVAVTESWLHPDVKDSEVTINFPGYSILRCDRMNRTGGGVCVFLRDDISGECLTTFDNGVCELLVIKVHSLNMILVVVYRPPDTRISEFSPLLSELENSLNNFSGPKFSVLMVGDFNFPECVMSWVQIDEGMVPHVHNHYSNEKEDGLQTRLQAKRLCDVFTNCHMTQLVDKPTCGREILDLVLTSDNSSVSHIDMEYFPSFSDHKLLSVNLTTNYNKCPQKPETFLLDSARRLKRLDFNKAPWGELRRTLREVDWDPMVRIAKCSTTAAHNYMLYRLLPILEECVPLKSSSKRARSRMHRDQKLLWRKIRRIKLKMSKTVSVHKLAQLLKVKTMLEKELKDMYLQTTSFLEARAVNDIKQDSSRFFSYAKARQKTKTKVGPFTDPETGELMLDPDYTAQRLSDQYSSVFNKPRPEWSIADIEDFFKVNSSRTGTDSLLTDVEFTEADIELACSELSIKSAPGPDGIPASLLKICSKEVKKPLHILWSESMRQGVIPPDLLLVHVCPIHKGGSKVDPSQYRPVALTSHLIKVFERVVRKVLVQYLESMGHIPNEQHGFRSSRSTLTQLLAHWDSILDHLENDHSVDVIYTDFSKAFDKCETNVLLHTLKDCGVQGRIGKWIAAFLDSNTRRQAVGVDGRLSTLVPVISGVPQGTVLGPVLFLVHIRGISSRLSAESQSSSFADDTRIWRGIATAEDCKDLQKDLCSVYEWASDINMQFNSKKFEWVRYSSNSSSLPDFKYEAPDKTTIEVKSSVKDLGVILSSDLSFSLQIQKAVSSASQMVGWCLRTFRGRGSFLLMTLFKSLVQPHLDYCNQIWAPTKQEDINKIEQVQRELVSRIRDSSLVGLDYWNKLAKLKLYSQERRRERYQIIFIWKISQGLVSGYSLDFTPCSGRTGRKAIPKSISNKAPALVRNARAATIGFRGAQLFNLMPLSLRNSDHGDLLMFKNHLDIYLGCIPDQPTTQGLSRSAKSNSLMEQVPLYENN